MSGLGNMTNPNAKGFSLVNGFIMVTKWLYAETEKWK